MGTEGDRVGKDKDLGFFDLDKFYKEAKVYMQTWVDKDKNDPCYHCDSLKPPCDICGKLKAKKRYEDRLRVA